MYKKTELESYASFSNILKILKSDKNFNHFCTQHRVAKGTSMTIGNSRKVCYLLESGYLQQRFIGEDGVSNYFINFPGEFVTLPIIEEHIPYETNFSFLSDAVWWEIDFEYLRGVLRTEDPKNFILLQFAVESRYRLYTLATMRKMDAEKRVIFTLLRLARFGMRVKDDQRELPLFTSYAVIADMSDTSKSYTTAVLAKLRKQDILVSQNAPWVIKKMGVLQDILGTDIEEKPPF
ncbi:hypothetical protein PWEIH_06064 [Listeria weihenstephanensis FSL R9-0317]|uniref:Crp/Fnr family transcriptional regulator n=2 Tax=Listeria weihenstephanensis TaxID=1006155 RepID=A0A1S7FRA4_9LIST|nr:Crp/Fnr family transcriptional regulator [Listeria weihenstephanensis]AQY49922.1 hypothetical protein UE46_01895 [Listeria weihenstephanensis]EUJ39830.1 hypothetical protein PWEIH_06064 [Listeria weihenstephanensis FSL R9-0317]